MGSEATYDEVRIDGRLDDRPEREVDVAIVGAGVSGLYAGWRLRTAGDPPSVAVFEWGERVGGRLWTTTELPGLNGMVAELGGMRYMKHQQLFHHLAAVLGLATERFPMGDPNRNLFFLRNTRFTENRWTDPRLELPYKLPERLRHKHPDTLFGMAIDEVLAANGIRVRPKNRQEWDAVKPHLKYDRGPDAGQLLTNVGFWNLLAVHFGAEAYDLLANAGGFFSNTINWNATEALPYVVGDFSGDVEYLTLKGGLDQVPRRLCKQFVAAGGEVVGNARLVNFRPTTGGSPRRYELEFFDPLEGGRRVYADRIVLAMPRRSLELLSRDNPLFDGGRNEQFIHLMRAVIPEPSFKILMGFAPSANGRPWWSLLGLQSGRSITDLPIRQCYYFGTHPETRHSLLLASYNDMRSVTFWKPLEAPDAGRADLHLTDAAAEAERFEPTPTSEVSMEALLAASQRYPQAPKRMVGHALAQLAEVHGIPRGPRGLPDPYTTAYVNWTHDPYGGGYHAWKARYDVGASMKRMRKPLPDHDVHVCGEAYSDQQAWAEGALCIAELMLQEHFGLDRPRWLPAGYYLGR